MTIDRRTLYFVVTYIIILSFVGCNRNITPSFTTKIKKYDSLAFDRLYVEGIKLKLTGNGGEAIKFFEQCLRLNPESDAANYQIAQILIAKGNIEQAKGYMIKAYNKDKYNIWYLMMLANTYYRQNNIDSAIMFYEEAVKHYPEKMEIKMNLGSLYSENRDFSKAREIYENIDKEYGLNESSSVALVQNLMWEGNYKEALIKIEELLNINPDEILYNGLLAEIYRGQGKDEEALQVYNRMIERNPDDPQTLLSLCDFLINENSFEELFMVVNTVLLNEKITREDKLTLFARMIQNPSIIEQESNKLILAIMIFEAEYRNDHVIQILRPEVLLQMNKIEDAIILLEEIIKKQPDNYFAYEKLLLLYLDRSEFIKLEEKGKECAVRFNRSFLAKILYATGATENENYDIALEELRKAEILAGNNKEMIMQVVSMRADIYYRMKNYEKAFMTFEQALEYDRNDLMTLNNYAYYLAERDIKLKDAEEMSYKVIETEPDNNTYLDTYGWVLYKRGKYREAEKIFERIIKSGGNDAEYFEHYGYILKKRRKCNEASDNWEKALELDKNKTYLNKEIENCKKH